MYSRWLIIITFIALQSVIVFDTQICLAGLEPDESELIEQETVEKVIAIATDSERLDLLVKNNPNLISLLPGILHNWNLGDTNTKRNLLTFYFNFYSQLIPQQNCQLSTGCQTIQNLVTESLLSDTTNTNWLLQQIKTHPEKFRDGENIISQLSTSLLKKTGNLHPPANNSLRVQKNLTSATPSSTEIANLSLKIPYSNCNTEKTLSDIAQQISDNSSYFFNVVDSCGINIIIKIDEPDLNNTKFVTHIELSQCEKYVFVKTLFESSTIHDVKNTISHIQVSEGSAVSNYNSHVIQCVDYNSGGYAYYQY